MTKQKSQWGIGRLQTKLSDSVHQISNDTTKTALLSLAGGVAAISLTFGILFYRDVQRHRNSKQPLGYKPIVNPQYPDSIKDRTAKDIVKDRFVPSKTKIPKNVDYIVIGSGIGGLSTAALLSRAGRKCLVLEQHDRLGGCMHQYSRGFGFDVGIHYVGHARKHEKAVRCITDKEAPQYPIKFVQLGTNEDGFTFDKYLLGTGKDQIIYDAKAGKDFEDVKKYFENDPKQLELISKFEEKMDRGIKALTFAIMARIVPSWIGKLIFSICKRIYSDVWNKTTEEVLLDIGCTKNSKLAMILLANFGNFGGLRNENSWALVCGMKYHYNEGGFYIEGGPQQITRAIMPVIEKAGGRCLANAKVSEILFDSSGKAVGVSVERGGKYYKFFARRGIISAIGLRGTFKSIAPIDKIPFAPLEYKRNIKRALDEIPYSPQHFQCFIGLNKSSKELNLPSHNRWCIQFSDKDTSNGNFDYDRVVSEFTKDPINAPLMGFVGFPSAKDPKYSEMYGENKSVCVIVTEVPKYHFNKWKDEKCGARSEEYELFKKTIGDRLVEELLFKPFPQTRDCVGKCKYGTPLSSNYYIGSLDGESYGLHNHIKRLFDFDIASTLTPKTPIKGLYLSGQDLVSAGWAGALNGGILCAESILGYHNGMASGFAGRSLIKDIAKLDGVYKAKPENGTPKIRKMNWK